MVVLSRIPLCCARLPLSPKSCSRCTISYEIFCFSSSGSSFRRFSSRVKTFCSLFTFGIQNFSGLDCSTENWSTKNLSNIQGLFTTSTARTSSTGSASWRIRIDSSTLLICSSVYCTTSAEVKIKIIFNQIRGEKKTKDASMAMDSTHGWEGLERRRRGR